MAQQTIDIGTAANDGTGDDLRTGATKINQNFQELYTDVAALQVATGSSITGIGFDSGRIVFEGATNDANETTFQVVDPSKDNTITLPDSSGTVALISDITSIVDSDYVALITGTAFSAASTLTLIGANALDSARALVQINTLKLLDSDRGLALIDANALDSGRATGLIDAAYVQARENNPTLGVDFVDSDEALKLIDGNALDSGRATSLIDSAYLKFRVDSDYVKDIIDSAHVIGKAAEIDLRNYTVASVPTGQTGKVIFVSNGASGQPCLAVHDGTNYKRIALGTQIST